MDWKYFKNEKPDNNEEVLVWFDGEGVESVDLLTYSEGANGYWSCESDGEIFHPDRWWRIVPPINDMGFNLEMFFAELLEMLGNSEKQGAGDAQSDLRSIEEYVKGQRDYALNR